jgi:endonuclease/exonuclease/phosphatase family metal-dependent hydrolase
MLPPSRRDGVRSVADTEEREELMPDDRAAAHRIAVATPEISAVRVATYNIHTCVGVDRRCDPARIAAVLREIAPDIACVQEVDARHHRNGRLDQWAYLAAATGFRVVPGEDIRSHRGRFGNAILTRLPVLAVRAIDLSVGGYEPRSAIDAEILVGDRVLRVVATHFGLHAGERRLQANRLLAVLDEPGRRAQPVLLMGDLNEWRGSAGGLRLLERQLGPSEGPRTFPSWLPVLSLDRIIACGPAFVRRLEVYRSPLARVASDHLPLVGELCWGEAEPRRPRPRRLRRARPAARVAARVAEPAHPA